MLKLNLTSQFKRDLKLCKKRNYNISLLNTIVDTLRIPAPLPPKTEPLPAKAGRFNMLLKQPKVVQTARY